MLALTVLLLVAAIRSTVPGGTHKAIYFELFSTSLFGAALILMRSEEAYTRLALGLVAVGLIVALSAHPTISPNEPLAVAGATEIETGLYPAFGALAALTVLAARTRGLRRVLWLAIASYLAVMSVRSGSRSDLVGFAAAAALAALLVVVRSRDRLRAGLLVVAAAAAIVTAFGTLAGPGALSRYQRLTSDKERQFLAQRGLDVAEAHPFGTGIGGFSVNLPETGPFAELPHPHNVVLELLDDGGGLTAGIFLAVVAAALRYATLARSRSAGAFVATALVLGLTSAQLTGSINGDRVVLLMAGAGLALAVQAPPRLRAGRDAPPGHIPSHVRPARD
jgi:hypothetical protein